MNNDNYTTTVGRLPLDWIQDGMDVAKEAIEQLYPFVTVLGNGEIIALVKDEGWFPPEPLSDPEIRELIHLLLDRKYNALRAHPLSRCRKPFLN